jgi:uncharacterized protein YyaL (SSP411 family)
MAVCAALPTWADSIAVEPVSANPETQVVSLERDDSPALTPITQRPLRHGVFRWTSYPAAWTAAQKTNRPILLYVTSTQCPHCVRMLSDTYRLPTIQATVTNSFETLYVERSSQPKLVEKLRIRLFPTTMVVGPNNKVIDVMEGYMSPDVFARRLQVNLAANPVQTR